MSINLADNEKLKDACWRVNEYNKTNSIKISRWIPIKLCIMSELYNNHPNMVIQKDLSEMYNLHKSNVSRCLTLLQSIGFIKIERLCSSSMAKGIELTSDGMEFCNYVFKEN